MNTDCCENHDEHRSDMQAVLGSMPDIDSLFDLAELFKMFADTTRVRIMSVLVNRELCVCDIAEALNLGQSAVSHQLRLLRQAKLVRVRREGKSAFYALDDEHVRLIMELGLEHVHEGTES